MPKPEPRLPLGTSSTLRGLSETFAFHSSPESFITSRIISFNKEHPELVQNRSVVRAKVLNRNVAVVSSYAQVRQVLEDDSGYEASVAYAELMAPFFPSPNLLLVDGSAHAELRNTWDARVGAMHGKLHSLAQQQTETHFSEPSASAIDIYESLKGLSWKILLGAFVGLGPEDGLFDTVERLQEDLLRGQFSLFPVTLNTGFWHSPRKKGKDANKKLQALMLDRLNDAPNACPFAAGDEAAQKDIANHTVLMTCSLAVKALASLLTALLLNLYLQVDKSGHTLAVSIANEADLARQSQRLRSVLLETERLSPPIVGVMRRSVRDNVISSPGDAADVMVTKGWDCWLYFVGSGRDPATFGASWDVFDPDRYLDTATPLSIAFGAGPKTCLGREWIHNIALAVAETCLQAGVGMEGHVAARGVRGWLGWEPNDMIAPEDWARDMKQLPTQRPTEPVMVRVSRSS